MKLASTGILFSKADLRKMVGGKPKADNLNSFFVALDKYGDQTGLGAPHRLAMLVAQVAHETAGFRYDKELWGPTPAQRRYDTRTDLGNTPERDGDGAKYKGRGAIQITGRANYRDFTKWCKTRIDKTAPSFARNPDLVNTDPWEGLTAIWYWSTRHLNNLADRGAFDAVTRKINGGQNGQADRRRRYVRAGMVLLGYDPQDVRGFQTDAGLKADGIAGDQTRAALHKMLFAAQGPHRAAHDADVGNETRKPIKPAHAPANGGFAAILGQIIAAILKAIGGRK